MSHWTFVIAAYAVTALGVGALLLASIAGMRRAERDADALRRDR